MNFLLLVWTSFSVVYSSIQGTSSAKGKEINSLNYGDRFRVSGTNGDLSIVDVHLEDEQWYWCEAFNKAGTVTGKAYLEVQSECFGVVFSMYISRDNFE